uniref:clusterin-like isoform X2 n=1 Tax=Myxine glutinosa TaxID=7769 RepID=UPI0035901D79
MQLACLRGKKKVMKFVLFWSFLAVLASTHATLLPDEHLQRISHTSERFMDHELQKNFRGFKNLKLYADRNDEGLNRMNDWLKSFEEKKQAGLEQQQAAEEKLKEELRKCSDDARVVWANECRPCLEQSCHYSYFISCSYGPPGVSGSMSKLFEHMDSLFGPGRPHGSENVSSTNYPFNGLASHFDSLKYNINRMFERTTHMLENSAPAFRGILGPEFLHWFRSPSPPRLARSIQPFTSHLGLWNNDPFSMSHPSDPFRSPFGLSDRLFGFMRKMVEKFSAIGSPALQPIRDEGNGTCREVRWASKGCKEKEKNCKSCQTLLEDCPGLLDLHEELSQNVQFVEALGSRYNQTQQNMHRQMIEANKKLEQLMDKFGWVANITDSHEDPQALYIKTVMSRNDPDGDGPVQADTEVTVNVLNSPDLVFTLPGELEWNDPKFAEILAARALEKYRKHISETTTA